MKLVYVSVPVDALNREDAVKVMEETASLLDPSEWIPLFNRTALDLPEDDPQRLWKHLSQSMLLLGECDALLFSPGWDFYPCWVCSAELDIALRAKKHVLYTWRDADRTLHLLNSVHCGMAEKREEEEK